MFDLMKYYTNSTSIKTTIKPVKKSKFDVIVVAVLIWTLVNVISYAGAVCTTSIPASNEHNTQEKVKCRNANESATCQVFCLEGYSTKSGTKIKVTCEQKRWSFPDEKCISNVSVTTTTAGQPTTQSTTTTESENCPRQPPCLDGNHISPRSDCETSPESSCLLTCDGGYRVDETNKHQIIKCKKSGVWSSIKPCQEILCDELASTYTRTGNGCQTRSIGATCELGCNSKFKLEGQSVGESVTATCRATNTGLSASWRLQNGIANIPNCIEICPRLPTIFPSNTNARPKVIQPCDRSTGSECSIQCKDGYKFTVGGGKDKTIECESDGEWSLDTSEVTCEEIICSTIESILPSNENQKPKVTGQCQRPTDSSCRIRCETGYKFSVGGGRDKTIRCQDDGEWSMGTSQVTCEVITCPDIDSILPSDTLKKPQVIDACGNTAGSQCDIQCKDGYKFSDDENEKSIRCRNSGDWSMGGEAVSCEEITCDLPSYSHPYRKIGQQCDSKLVGAVCNIACANGYKYHDSSSSKEISCVRSGLKASWQPEITDTCQKIRCNDPEFNTAGVGEKQPRAPTGPFYAEQDYEFTCPNGYIYEGSRKIRVTCEQDGITGRWSRNMIPACTRNIISRNYCDYWFSDDIANANDAHETCQSISRAVLAMPKELNDITWVKNTIRQIYPQLQISKNIFAVGARFNKSRYIWNDGDELNNRISVTTTSGACVALAADTRNQGRYPCDQSRRYICEKPSDTKADICSPNPCKAEGLCKPYGCSFKCDCPEGVYGYTCDKAPINITLAAAQAGRVSYTVKSNAGTATFELYINGEKKETMTGIDATLRRGNYVIKNIQGDIYVSGKAFLNDRPFVSTNKCTKIEVNSSPPTIKNDTCDGSVLSVQWNKLQTEELQLQYELYTSQNKANFKKREPLSSSNSYTIKDLQKSQRYNIKIVPVIDTCTYDEYPDLFESHTGTTSEGPPGASIVTIKMQKNWHPYSNCSIKWENNRKNLVGGYEIKIVEKNKENPSQFKNLSIPDTNYTLYIHATKPNSIYDVSIGTKPPPTCQNVPISWSNVTSGCETDSAGPSEIEAPLKVISPEGSTVTAKITSVDERNGQVSCYFIVVRKKNETDSHNGTIVDGEKLLQENSTGNEELGYIALAIPRFDGEDTIVLGDEKQSCCDMTNGSSGACEQGRKKRAIANNIVHGENKALDPETIYQHYIVVSTPRSNRRPEIVSGPLSEPWSSKVADDDEGNSNLAVAVAVPIIVILAVILVVGFILYRRRPQKTKPIGREHIGMNRARDDYSLSVEDPVIINLDVRDPSSIVEEALARHSFQLQDLFQLINDKRANEDMMFLEEFKRDVPRAIEQCRLTFDMSKLPANRPKNRYKNIVPYDNSRVVLENLPGNEFSNYINAAYIDGYQSAGKFIATQGPLPDTIADFWRMVWEMESTVITVLTRLKEKNKVKCAQYWPEEEDASVMHNDLKVTLIETTNYGDFLRRKFQLSKDEEMRNVFQFQFVAWPDHGIPNTTSSILRFRKSVMQAHQPSAGPIVIHCSAGVGRTGTFIALDILSQQIRETDEINICSIVGRMRTRRPEMVQTLEQYIYIHKLVLELYQYGETDIDVSNFNEAYSNVMRMNGQERGIDQEFASLDYFLPLETDQDTAQKPENKLLNRDSTILPYDHNLAFIQMSPTDKGVPYYNASTIASYHTTDRFIAAQTPDQDTTETFWRTVLDNDVSMIVGLCQVNEESNYCYWPEPSQLSKFGQITVRNINEKSDMGCVERQFEVSIKDKKVTVSQILYEQWPEHDNPTSSGTILDIIAKVEKHHQTLSNYDTKTTLVHCSVGAGRTGTFCAISNLIERLKNENRVDIFRTVKDLRDQRPGMVQTVEQYEFCYKAVSEFLQSFDLYGNFQ